MKPSINFFKFSVILIISNIMLIPSIVMAKSAASTEPAPSISAKSTSTSDFHSLKALLAPVESLSADFQQELISEKGNALQQTKGKMWLKKPGQFRWEVQGKDPRLVVSNGKQIWDYDKDLEQVTIQTFAKGEAKAPIFFLTGDVNSLEKDFKIQNFTEASKPCMRGAEQCFELKPKNQQSPFQSIRIGFINKVLSNLEMTDQLGQQSYFKFTNAKLNATIAPNLFHFVAPKGVDVVGN